MMNDVKDKVPSEASSIAKMYSNKRSKMGTSPTHPAAVTGSVIYLNQTHESMMRSKFARERSSRLSVGRSDHSELRNRRQSNAAEAYSTIRTLTGHTRSVPNMSK